jgi:hypothetical protein
MHVSNDLLSPPSGLSMRMTSNPGLRFAGPGLTSRRGSAARLVIFHSSSGSGWDCRNPTARQIGSPPARLRSRLCAARTSMPRIVFMNNASEGYSGVAALEWKMKKNAPFHDSYI